MNKITECEQTQRQQVESQNVMGGGNKQKHRILGLDCFRIFLMLVIFMFHSQMHFSCDYGILNSFISMGAIAMTGFFILSGFSLQLSSTNSKLTDSKEITHFYLKRLISIIPLYFFVHIVRFVCDGFEPIINRLILFPIQTLGLQALFSSLFRFSHNGGTWFISCLLVCYFVFPLIHILLSKLTTKQNLILLFTLAFVLLWGPVVQRRFGTNSIYDNPFFRLIEFTIGILSYNLWATGKPHSSYLRVFNWPMALVSVLLLIISISYAHIKGMSGSYMTYNIFVLPCFVVLMICLPNIQFRNISGTKMSQFIRYTSGLALPFFLSQCIGVWRISRCIVNFVGINTNLLRIVISLLVCCLMAVILHEFIEKPSSKYLKQKFLYK